MRSVRRASVGRALTLAWALSLCVLSLCILSGASAFADVPSSPGRPAGPGRPEGPFVPAGLGVRGIDVSHYQGRVDWAQVADSGHRFVFAKATEGRHYVDPTYLANKEGAEAHGLAFGAYHFADPEHGRIDAIREANHFVEAARLRPGNLLPVLDLETTGGLDHRQLTRWILTWLRQVRDRLGVRPIVYTSPVGWALRTGDTEAIARAGFEQLWVAHWGVDTPAVPAGRWDGNGWTFWQRDACGSVPGISGCVDVDVAGRSLDVATIPVGFDQTPPTVSVAMTTDVDQPIAVTFDEPVDGVSRDSVRLRGATVRGAPRVAWSCRSDYGTAMPCDATGVGTVELLPVEPLVPGEVYDLVVDDTVTDLSGNALERTVDAVAAPVEFSQGSAAIDYRWAEVARDNAFGGTYAVERRPGATATFAFRGSSITLVTAKGPDLGRVAVRVDGVSFGELDLHAERPAFGVTDRFDGLGAGPHAIELTVRGRGSRHPEEAAVVIDAFRTSRGLVADPVLETTWAVRSDGVDRRASSALAGASAEVGFFGTGILWHTIAGPEHGRAALWVDGAFVRSYDAGAAARGERLERVDGLPVGRHTLRIVVLGPAAATLGGDTAVSVDGFSILP